MPEWRNLLTGCEAQGGEGRLIIFNGVSPPVEREREREKEREREMMDHNAIIASSRLQH